MNFSKQWQHHKGSVLDSCDGFHVMECEPCGFKHIIPIPTTEELDHLYRQDYYSNEKPLYLKEHQEDLEWWNLVYDERYDHLENFLPGERRRLLDVGAGPGYFLLRGKARGWETVGIEPSVQAAEHSRKLGLHITEGFLSDALVESLGKFDVVHMHEVLEHIPDPAHLVSLVHRLLSPGGVLCAIVPNDYSPLQRVLRDHLNYSPWWVSPPHHINYFDHHSLHRLLEGRGFDILHKSATFPVELFLFMGCNYVGNNSVGRMVHRQRKHMELNLAKAGCGEMKRKAYEALAFQGMGREAVVYARAIN